MTWYVAIPRINGRLRFWLLARELDIHGFEDRVEYSEGGWADYEVEAISPHLKFEYEDDAIAYVLTYGGEVSRKVPTRHVPESG